MRLLSTLALIAAVVLCTAVLAGCATTGARAVPDTLLTCDPQPPAPKKPASQRSVGLYIVDLAAAGDDCRSKLGSVRELVRPEK